MKQEKKTLLMLGAGGHARVLMSLVHATGDKVSCICDPFLAASGVSVWHDIPVLGGDEELDRLDPAEYDVIVGIGQMPNDDRRHDVFCRAQRLGFRIPALIHPRAWACPTASLGEGVQIMAGAIVQSFASLGDNSLVNTNASIDHDCVIGPHVHVAPGATICGEVKVGERSFIGAGSTIIQGVTLAPESFVRANALVSHGCKEPLAR